MAWTVKGKFTKLRPTNLSETGSTPVFPRPLDDYSITPHFFDSKIANILTGFFDFKSYKQ